MYVFTCDRENVFSLVEVRAVGVVVDERVVFIDYFAEAFFFAFVNRELCFLEACFENEEFEFFFIFGVRVIAHSVLCYDDATEVVVAHISAEVVI